MKCAINKYFNFLYFFGALSSKPPLGSQKQYAPPFFNVKVLNLQSQNKAKSTSFELQISSAAGKWKSFKTYKEVEEFSNQISQLYHKMPVLAKHSNFEPLFFGQPDHTKATLAVQKFMDTVCTLPYVDYVSPMVEFMEYAYGLDCLNQMSKVREYRNKHGMTLTHFSMDSGLELNYALFSRDSSQKGNSNVNMSVLEGWETSKMEHDRIAKRHIDENLPLEEIKEVAEPVEKSPQPLEVTTKEMQTVTHNSDNNLGSTKAGSVGITNGPLSATGSMENTLKDKLIDGVEALVKMSTAIDLDKPVTIDPDRMNNPDPMKSPRQHTNSISNVVTRESLSKRDKDSKVFQKKALGIFHKKHISRNLDCCVTCFEAFSEADLIIAGLENGKIAAFKEVIKSDTDEFGLELLSRVKVFKEAVTHISLSSTKGVLYCIGDKDTLAVIDLCSWKVIDKHSLGGTVTEFLYNDDYQVAFVANAMSRITLVNLADPKKVAKTQLKAGEDDLTTTSIRHMDLDSEAGLLFCSDNTSGLVSVFDIDYPFTFQSKITKKSSAFGLGKCKDLSWWEARKEVYCGFKGGIVTVHRLSPAGNLDFVSSCRISSADLHLVAHYGTCPYLFIAASDGCLTLWSPPKNWLTPFNRNTSAIEADMKHNVGQPAEKTAAPKDECYSDDDGKERNYSPANSC